MNFDGLNTGLMLLGTGTVRRSSPTGHRPAPALLGTLPMASDSSPARSYSMDQLLSPLCPPGPGQVLCHALELVRLFWDMADARCHPVLAGCCPSTSWHQLGSNHAPGAELGCSSWGRGWSSFRAVTTAQTRRSHCEQFFGQSGHMVAQWCCGPEPCS